MVTPNCQRARSSALIGGVSQLNLSSIFLDPHAGSEQRPRLCRSTTAFNPARGDGPSVIRASPSCGELLNVTPRVAPRNGYPSEPSSLYPVLVRLITDTQLLTQACRLFGFERPRRGECADHRHSGDHQQVGGADRPPETGGAVGVDLDVARRRDDCSASAAGSGRLPLLLRASPPPTPKRALATGTTVTSPRSIGSPKTIAALDVRPDPVGEAVDRRSLSERDRLISARFGGWPGRRLKLPFLTPP